jgi:hypothetical protein
MVGKFDSAVQVGAHIRNDGIKTVTGALGQFEGRFLWGGDDSDYPEVGAELNLWFPEGESAAWKGRAWYSGAVEDGFSMRFEGSSSGMHAFHFGNVGVGAEARYQGLIIALVLNPLGWGSLEVDKLWPGLKFKMKDEEYKWNTDFSPGASFSVDVNRDGRVSHSFVSRAHIVKISRDKNSSNFDGGVAAVENTFKIQARIYQNKVSGFISATHIMLIPYNSDQGDSDSDLELPENSDLGTASTQHRVFVGAGILIRIEGNY